MAELAVWLDDTLVGRLSHAPETNRFRFEYEPAWKQSTGAFAIGPRIPLVRDPSETEETHSAIVRQFFENLLPEGQALDDAAQSNGLSTSNVFGLIAALGKETAGALRMALSGANAPSAGPVVLREVTARELSERIRNRRDVPFSVWDGRVRLSIAGFQDKIAVCEREGRWFLVDGPPLASTFIVKPVPARESLASLPANEYFCMDLARRVGLVAAEVSLVEVPEPVLFVRRFDREETGAGVRRLHVVDACQALGLGVSMKYEQQYGNGEDVKHLRDGVSLPKLFGLLDLVERPAVDRLRLLQWVVFQVLIGNTDAHGKNVSFHCGPGGLRLAPAYDIVCIPALGDRWVHDTLAMAVGDAFREAEITPYEWAHMAALCGLTFKLVSDTVAKMARAILDALPAACAAAERNGVGATVASAIANHVAPVSERHLAMVPAIRRFKPGDF